MPIPETQLETWSHQGAIVSSQTAHQSIRAALSAPASPITGRIAAGEIQIQVQGSYKNDTNIHGDSDVDVIVELNSIFYSNLTDAAKQWLGITPAAYSWYQFRSDVVKALQSHYGPQFVDTTGNKAVKIQPGSGRLGADVVPCATYKLYRTL